MSDPEYVFPLDEYGHVAADARFRVLFDNLCYGDLAPEEIQGQIFASKGDVITAYPEIRPYPERIQILIKKRYIEYVPPPQEYTPRKRRYGTADETESVNDTNSGENQV